MLIQMNNITKSYYLASGQEIPVLKWIDVSIEEGESVALMGPSGSGKSTLLNIIGFLHPSTAGEYLFLGEDVSEFKDDVTLSYIRNKKCGFIFQQYFLIPRLTAVQNVMLPGTYAWYTKREWIEKATKLLQKVGLGDKLHNKPNELSWGQQQRVAIARSLMNDPNLILADEPTWALDSTTSQEVIELIMSFKEQGTTIVMVTHEEKIASFADRIIRLNDGVIQDHWYATSNDSSEILVPSSTIEHA